jgi:hypothetical protein
MLQQFKESLVKHDDSSDSIYREAVVSYSPGLPRFAATLGNKECTGRNPIGVVSLLAFVTTNGSKLKTNARYC